MILIVRPRAFRELAEIQDWYEERSPGLGLVWLREVERAVKRIMAAPDSCPMSRPPVRSLRLRRFPYHMFYWHEDDEIIVAAVLHIRRHPVQRPGESPAR